MIGQKIKIKLVITKEVTHKTGRFSISTEHLRQIKHLKIMTDELMVNGGDDYIAISLDQCHIPGGGGNQSYILRSKKSTCMFMKPAVLTDDQKRQFQLKSVIVCK